MKNGFVLVSTADQKLENQIPHPQDTGTEPII